MQITRQPGGGAVLLNVSAFMLHTLRMLPALADPGTHAGAKRRLFPKPFADAESTEEQREDWQEFVVPELRAGYENAFSHVLDDLAGAVRCHPPLSPRAAKIRRPRRGRLIPPRPPEAPDIEPGGPYPTEGDEEAEEPDSRGLMPQWKVAIPPEHIEDWFRAMNAARLVMSERYGCHRDDLEYVLSVFNSGNRTLHVQYELLTGLCGIWVEMFLS